ncbi:hypothetical protein SK128_010266, partial [Halocaridina rubra]
MKAFWYVTISAILVFWGVSDAFPDGNDDLPPPPPPPNVPPQYINVPVDIEFPVGLGQPAECTARCTTFSEPNFICTDNGQRFWNDCFYNVAKCSNQKLNIVPCDDT